MGFSFDFQHSPLQFQAASVFGMRGPLFEQPAFVLLIAESFSAGGRWGSVQTAANEDTVPFLCKRTCLTLAVHLGAYQTQLVAIIVI